MEEHIALPSPPSPSPSSPPQLQPEPLTSKIYLCYSYTPKSPEGDWTFRVGYDFFSIDLNNGQGQGQAAVASASLKPPNQTLAPVIPSPPSDTPHLATWCRLGTKIYGIGGSTYPFIPKRGHSNIVASPHVCVFDTKFPDEGWVTCRPMTRGRILPYVAPISGNLFAFDGRIMNPKSPKPSLGEVYYPEQNQWFPLAPLEYSYVYSIFLLATESKWAVLPEPPETPCSFPLLVDNILYAVVEGNDLYACDLSQNPHSFHKVSGFEKDYTCPPRHWVLEECETKQDTNRYLFHLGNQNFCMVWTDRHVNNRFSDNVVENVDHNPLCDPKFTSVNIIRNLKFNVQRIDKSNWTARIDTCDCYYVRATELCACFAIDEEHNFDEETNLLKIIDEFAREKGDIFDEVTNLAEIIGELAIANVRNFDEETNLVERTGELASEERHNFDEETNLVERTGELVSEERHNFDEETNLVERTSIRDKLVGALPVWVKKLDPTIVLQAGAVGALLFLGRRTSG